ncbi:hypothetical protein ABW21_db0201793 [Orbilia brochopaga]|nr:hypothetical protein ABW21_db0201793 [Drechslerella brochopaga]
MLFNQVALAAAFAATAFGAVLPNANSAKSLEKRDTVESLEVWKMDADGTEQYSKKTDDAWQKVKLKFPMHIFDKSSDTIWISMNGLISLDEPSKNPSVPARNLPINPASCRQGMSCVSNNTFAAMWQDLYLPAGTTPGGRLLVDWIYHYPSLSPTTGHHYHFEWATCDKKAVSGGIPPGERGCGKAASRAFTVNYYKNHPGVFHIIWYFNDSIQNPGIIGAQAYPKFLQIPYPGTTKDKFGSFACAIIDTIKGTATIPKTRDAC